MLEWLKLLFGPTIEFLLSPAVLLLLAAVVIFLIIKNIRYKKGTYYQSTKIPYLFLRNDVGKYGEYSIYKRLKKLEAQGAKFLFNVYIPKENGETTEIDVMMLCSKGIFVFESKNYSGWIFGNENQMNWYQTLPSGRGKSHKEKFYNPIMQNRSHIKHLENYLGVNCPLWSVIVFSERCTLKDVKVNSGDIKVINRYDILDTVLDICGHLEPVLSEADVLSVYDKLYPLTQVDESVKAKHIENILDTRNPEISAKEPQKEDTVTEKNPTVISEVTEEKTPESDVLKCPRCGNPLVLRTATRGERAGTQFYGCSNYPKCKYIQNIDEE